MSIAIETQAELDQEARRSLQARGRSPVIETEADLDLSDIPPLRFIIHGLLPEGLAALAGKPKRGKSWLVLGMAQSVATGRHILDRPALHGDVLYLALEDGRRRIQDRSRKVRSGHPASHCLHIAYQWLCWSDGGEEALEDWLKQHPNKRMIIIDTWAKVAPPPRQRGDAYSDTYAVLGRVQAMAIRHHIAIVLVTHARKGMPGGEEDYVDGVIGSTAITGAADTIMVLDRVRGTEAAVLAATGRDIVETTINLGWTPSGWAPQLAADVARRDQVVSAILSLMTQMSEWKGTAEELLTTLSGRRDGGHNGDGWPTTSRVLSERLNTHATTLRELGTDVSHCRGNGNRKGQKLIRIAKVAGSPPHQTPATPEETRPLSGPDGIVIAGRRSRTLYAANACEQTVGSCDSYVSIDSSQRKEPWLCGC